MLHVPQLFGVRGIYLWFSRTVMPIDYVKLQVSKENVITKGDGKHVWQIEEQGI